MATRAANFTVYIPKTPLNEQLQQLSSPKVKSIDMDPMVENAPPLIIKTIEFRPLKIEKALLNITLESRTSVGSDEEGIYFYDKYTFTIRSQDDQFFYPEVPAKNIEDIISKIYNAIKADG